MLTPTLIAISVVSFSFSKAAQRRPGGLALLDAGFLYHTLSPTSLQTHWLPVFTELYNSLIAHSISLEWHVWSTSSGNNCHAVHRSLSSSASVYDCTMGFYLVPYCQPSPPTRFLPITDIGMCHFLPVHHFGMACWPGRRSIYNTYTISYFPLSKIFPNHLIVDGDMHVQICKGNFCLYRSSNRNWEYQADVSFENR